MPSCTNAKSNMIPRVEFMIIQKSPMPNESEIRFKNSLTSGSIKSITSKVTKGCNDNNTKHFI